MIQPEIHSAIQGYYARLEPRAQDVGFICVYGSSVYEESNTTSDVDMFLVSSRLEHHLPDHVHAMAAFVREIHLEHDRELDEEVPYDNKLVYSPSELRDATSLECFESDASGQVIIPRVEKSISFLSSPGIKLRLALNALTTPHLIACDTTSAYVQHRIAAEVAMTVTGVSLCGVPQFTQDNVFEQLAEGSDGQIEEYHLGYKTHSREVANRMHCFIEESLHRLRKEDIIARIGDAYVTSDDFNAHKIAALFTQRGDIKS